MEDTKYNGLLVYFYKYSVCVLLFVVMSGSSTEERDENDSFNKFIEWHENVQYQTMSPYRKGDDELSAEVLRVHSSSSERDAIHSFNKLMESHENVQYQITSPNRRRDHQGSAEVLRVHSSSPERDENDSFNKFIEWHENVQYQTMSPYRRDDEPSAEVLRVRSSSSERDAIHSFNKLMESHENVQYQITSPNRRRDNQRSAEVLRVHSLSPERDENDSFNKFVEWHENVQYQTMSPYRRDDEPSAEVLRVRSSSSERDAIQSFNKLMESHENVHYQTTSPNRRRDNQGSAEVLRVLSSSSGQYRHGRIPSTGSPSWTNHIHSNVNGGDYVNSVAGRWTTKPSWRSYRVGSNSAVPVVDTTEGSSETSEEVKIPDNVIAFNKVPIFYDRDTIMDVFDIERKGHQVLVTEMMANYEHICLAKPDVPTPPPGKRKPFIVIEGNHRPSRKILAQRLAERLGGRSLDTPRKCLAPFVKQFPRGTKLRRAFFGLALYASEYKVRQLWDRSVATVMDGYWLDQTSLVIAWMFRMKNSTLPRAGDQIYSWPVDLMAPDLIFYLKVPDKAATNSPNTWMSLVPQVYKRIKYPKVVILIPKGGVNKTAEAIHEYIKKTLWKECDLSNTTPVPDSVHNDYDVLY